MHDMTIPTFEDRLTAYAELLVRVGVNLQPGQKLMVRANVDDAPLVRKVVDVAYSIGSPYVEVFWSDGPSSRSRFLKAPAGSFEIIPEYRAKGMIRLAEEGAASLAITSEDPDLMAGVDPTNLATFQAAWRKAVRPYMNLSMADKIAWCVAGAASPGWATKAFPGLPEAEAVEALWQAIFTATRITTADPVGEWRKHNEQLARMKEMLNQRRYAAVHFKGPGTDLKVGLADGHKWDGGVSHTPQGNPFVANMPTEEVFTAPHSQRVDGVVRASMPLSYNGTLIDDFTLTFEGGKVVKAVAGKGQAVLDSILSSDEGASRLGEVALVPASSPIAQAGILFLNTLFDENAASHIALGRGYDMTVEGSGSMSEAEKRATGLNDSSVHVDFMIGSAEMDVDGVKQDGSTEPLMRQGAWVS